jgi:hypothetical protein
VIDLSTMTQSLDASTVPRPGDAAAEPRSDADAPTAFANRASS